MREDKIEVSILVLVYNHEKYIRQSLDSVLEQSVNFCVEVLVIDDCSSDSSASIIMEEYGKRVTFVRSKKNLGGTKTYYYLHKKARGKYVICIEGDDYWCDTEKLQKMYDFLEQHHQYAAVTNGLKVCDKSGRIIGKLGESRDRIITMDSFLQGKVFFPLSGCMQRNFFLDTSHEKLSSIWKFDRLMGDFLICSILLDRGNVFYLASRMSVYRTNQGKKASNYNSIRSDFEKSYDKIKLAMNTEYYFHGKYSYSSIIYSRAKMQIKNSFMNYKWKEIMLILRLVCGRRRMKKRIQKGCDIVIRGDRLC